MSQPFRCKVEEGYDRVADQYLATKNPEDRITLSALEEMSALLPPEAAVLDFGCGAGIPAARWLAGRFAVTGVDISARQLELARRNAPDATFIKADMSEVEFEAGTFDAVVSLYAITHVPREEQPALLGNIHRWLEPDGLFLATWAVDAWEGEEEDWEGWGASMWWSNHDGETNLEMLRDNGFIIQSAEVRSDGNESWLWVLARKQFRGER